MNKLQLYYHVAPQNNWRLFFDNKISLIKSVGLWDAFNNINLCIHYDRSEFDQLQAELIADNRVRFIFHPDSVRPFGEQYTNRTIKQEADACTETSYILRLHSKGINHYDSVVDWPPNEVIAKELDYYNINLWRDAVSKLNEGYDAVGANWVKQPWPHFKGNIWWATSDYIKTVPILAPPHETGGRQQITGGGWTIHDAESWIGTGSPRAWDLLRNTDQIGNHPDIK